MNLAQDSPARSLARTLLPSPSIGVRLTAWYFVVLALALGLFGTAMSLAMRESVHAVVDDALRVRLEGVQQFMSRYFPGRSVDKISQELDENSELKPGDDLVQIADAEGNMIFRSTSIRPLNIPLTRTERPEIQTVKVDGNPFRILTAGVDVNGQAYTVQLAAQLGEFYGMLDHFGWQLLGSIPVVLLLATMGGYWISRRALAPVDEITRTARLISAQNLSQRLSVPKAGDELQRLAQTLNQMIARLEAAFQRNIQFTGDASHELRTPVTVIRTAAELALRRNRAAADYEEALRQILAEAERTTVLIENLMTLARADSGAAGLQFESADLAESVREACQEGRTLAAACDVQFHWEVPGGEMRVRGDPSALRRLFLILIDNALKYTPAGGEVSVSVRQGGTFVIGEVRDNGIGIAAEDLPNIFERFYRSDKARSRELGGAGLGLAIAKWIADAHGAGIQVESAPGQGSLFRVRIPLDAGLSVNAEANGRHASLANVALLQGIGEPQDELE